MLRRFNNNHYYNSTDNNSQHLLSIYYVPGAVLRALPQHFEKQPRSGALLREVLIQAGGWGLWLITYHSWQWELGTGQE